MSSIIVSRPGTEPELSEAEARITGQRLVTFDEDRKTAVDAKAALASSVVARQPGHVAAVIPVTTMHQRRSGPASLRRIDSNHRYASTSSEETPGATS